MKKAILVSGTILFAAILVSCNSITPATKTTTTSTKTITTTSTTSAAVRVSTKTPKPKPTLTTVTSTSVPVNTQMFSKGTFPGTVILGRPETDSITLSLLTAANADFYIQYGQAPGKYDKQTGTVALQKDQPLEYKVTGLNIDSTYYYRICCKQTGESSFSAGAEASFSTQKAAGENFVFTIDADPHFDNNANPDKVKLTFQNILSEHPDFDIDLGDTFMTEKMPGLTAAQIGNVYVDRRIYFSVFGSSVPLFLANGNHDGEQGWLLNGTANNEAVLAATARNLYYPNPLPDSFYSGDSTSEPFVGLRENYYSWTWGDALFVVLDPYWYTTAGKTAGWDWTLGKTQYDWLRTTLENSKAKYKFVFAHQLEGGFDMGTTGNGRGGAEAAMMYEWGGQNADGSWGFDQNRPGWGKPIQQLLVDNNVTAFFHGHDHLYAYQQLNGVVYQDCPQPGAINDKNSAATYGYTDGVILSSSGHIRVTVSDSGVTVDYVRTYMPGEAPSGHLNDEIAYSYTIPTK
jgi:hypothetical protein